MTSELLKVGKVYMFCQSLRVWETEALNSGPESSGVADFGTLVLLLEHKMANVDGNPFVAQRRVAKVLFPSGLIGWVAADSHHNKCFLTEVLECQ